MIRKTGKLFVLFGPAGVGKTTLIKAVCELAPDKISRIVTCTTRQPRKNETEGQDYFFLSQRDFNQKIKDKEFFEWTKFGNYFYATPNKQLKQLGEGKNLILSVELEGIRKFATLPNTIFIRITCDKEKLIQRILLRNGKTCKNSIKSRLALDMDQLEAAHNEFSFSYVVHNNDIEEAKKKLMEIIISNIS